MAEKYFEQAPGGEITAPDGTEKVPVTKSNQDYFVQILNWIARKLRETGGPTTLSMGAVADGEWLKRSGTSVIGGTVGGGPFANFKNFIINGDMSIAQRGTSFAGITGSTTYTLDRWLPVFVTLGTWTASQEADGPTGSGLRRSLKLLVTVADPAPAAGDSALLRTKLEGQFLQPIRKGTASAKQLTLSFWVKSGTTGTYIVELQDVNNTRHCCASYTINSANTWEKKTITFPADTTGALNNDNAASFHINFWLAAGSNFTSGTLQTTWAAEVAANRAVGQVNLGAVVNNNIYFTGVQLELDATATEFEFLPFDIMLTRCLRYFQKSFPYATAPAQSAGLAGCVRGIAGKAGAGTDAIFMTFRVQMRIAPTIVSYNPSVANAQVRDSTAAADCSGTGLSSINSQDVLGLLCLGNAATAVGNLLDVHFTADAEL